MRTTASRAQGLTLLEVILAIAIIGVLSAMLTTAVVGNLQKTRSFGSRTQAAQILNLIGRRVAGGESALLPASGAPVSWDYGGLAGAFPDLATQGSFTEPDLYRAAVSNAGSVSLAGASLVEYDVSVCYAGDGGESCVRGSTLGPEPGGAANTAPLPGIN